MEILFFIISVYLLVGFIYALYLFAIGSSKLSEFPINMLGGPIIIPYIIYITRKGKDLPIGD